MADKIYDIIIIGAGPAGMTAAIYAGRSNKSVALIDKEGFGGNIAKSPCVENIPGFTSISGVDFASNMYEQITHLSSIEHIIDEVLLINYRYGLFQVSLTDGSIINGLSLIFATGMEHRTLDLPTKNIYYCVTCDGPFYKGKNVIVVGSGNTGATYAIELATYCKSVYLCDITSEPCCENVLKEKIKDTSNIYWLPNSTIKEVINKKDELTAVVLSTDETIKCNAIFAAIGLIPQTNIVKLFAELDPRGYIITKDCVTTKVPGVFAAGDCRDGRIKQVASACGDGATAAVQAIQFLNK